jgi:hypothetical protein
MFCLPVGREAECVDGVGVVKRVEVLAVVEVPEHGLGVLAAGGAQGTVGRHGHGVQVAGVTNVVGLKLAVGQVPDLKFKKNSFYKMYRVKFKK